MPSIFIVNIYGLFLWKTKKALQLLILSQKNLDEPNSERKKPNKIWVDKGEFYNISIKSWLQDNDTEIYSTHIEGKFVVTERFIRTLIKSKISRYINSVSKNVYIDKLDDIVNKYNTYHNTTKTKPFDVTFST